MITRFQELKILTKSKSCQSKCKSDGRKSNSSQTWLAIIGMWNICL